MGWHRGAAEPPGSPGFQPALAGQSSAELGSELLAGSVIGKEDYRAGQGDGEWVWTGADEERRVGRLGASGGR